MKPVIDFVQEKAETPEDDIAYRIDEGPPEKEGPVMITINSDSLSFIIQMIKKLFK